MRPLALRRDVGEEGVGGVAGTGGSTLGSGNGGSWSNGLGGLDMRGSTHDDLFRIWQNYLEKNVKYQKY